MRRRLLATLAGALTLVGLSIGADDAAEGFLPLVVGDDPSQFELVGLEPGMVRVKEGTVRISGEADGYIATRKAYDNYTLRFDWRYERPEGLVDDAAFDGNSGVLLHVQPPSKVWPIGIQVQLLYADAGNLFPMEAEVKAARDVAAQRKASRPVGEWNQAEITCNRGAITVRLNGLDAAKGSGAKPDRGIIAWQSEGRPIEFRNLRIKSLP